MEIRTEKWGIFRYTHLRTGDIVNKLNLIETMSEEFQKNVFGEKLENCSHQPLTGWFRDGCCNTDAADQGLHTVCVKATLEFLEFIQKKGNDLITPAPNFGFPGLKDGDCWCVCATSYLQAINSNVACPIYLKKTNEKTLNIIPMEKLKKFAIDLS